MIATVVRRTIALAAIGAALGACSRSGCSGLPASTVTFPDSGTSATLQVELARAPASWALGLMRRGFLPADRGELFQFHGPVDAPFWMKDTLIPLSIAFVGADGRIVDIQDMEPCLRDSCPLYRSSRPFVEAVEANQGYFLRHGVAAGDRVRVRIPTCY